MTKHDDINTDIIVLAAGNSMRFQDNKLLHIIQGKPMIQTVMEELRQVKCNRVIVVTQYEQIQKLARTYGFHVVINAYPQYGISYSIKIGLQEATGEQVIFVTGDLAYIKAATLHRLIAVSDNAHIICAASQGQTKNPVLFPAKFFPQLRNLSGDIGGKAIIKENPANIIKIEIADIELHDVDTKADIIE